MNLADSLRNAEYVPAPIKLEIHKATCPVFRATNGDTVYVGSILIEKGINVLDKLVEHINQRLLIEKHPNLHFYYYGRVDGSRLSLIRCVFHGFDNPYTA